MITMQVTVEVKDDRQVTVMLPPEVPIGNVELVISVASAPTAPKNPAHQLGRMGGCQRGALA